MATDNISFRNISSNISGINSESAKPVNDNTNKNSSSSSKTTNSQSISVQGPKGSTINNTITNNAFNTLDKIKVRGINVLSSDIKNISKNSDQASFIEIESKDIKTDDNLKKKLTNKKANDLISIINLASDATEDIENLVKSLDGIIQQAQKENIPQVRKAKLEQEYNSLVGEIKNKAQTSSYNGVKPLAGDEYKLKLNENDDSESVTIKLPNDANQSFGLTEINFSKPNALKQSGDKINSVKSQIKGLKDEIDNTVTLIKSKLTNIEIADENSESSKSTVRDLDQALEIAGSTNVFIRLDPSKALQSVGKIGEVAKELLK